MKMHDRPIPPPSLDIQEGQDVFISYSRQDQEFVRWLGRQFEAHGRQPWVDWSGIKPGEKWWSAILQGIDSATSFLFVLSPDSVESAVCRQEIDRAVESGKRIVPVVCREIEGIEVHPALAERNYVFLRTEEERRANLDKVIEALDTDLDHARAHTKFLVRAREWEAEGMSTRFLLRGGTLEEAVLWLSRAAGKQPAPTALQTDHILASRKAARRRQRLTMAAIAGGLVLASGSAAVAYVQRREAEAQTQEARMQLGRGYLIRAENHSLSSDAVFYVGRAVGFAALGKPELGVSEPSRIFLRRVSLDIKAVWNQIMGGSDPSAGGGEEFPVLFAGRAAAKEAVSAYRTVDLAPAHPFLWSSPVGSRHKGTINCVAFSPDGRTLASSSADNTVKLWEVATGKEKVTLSGHLGMVESVAFSPDGRTLASTSADKTVKLWDVPSGKEKITLSGHSAYGERSVAFSPDGRTLASASDYAVELREVSSGKEKTALRGHLGALLSVAFSPDGQTLASGSMDDTVKLWEVATGKEKATLSGHSGEVSSVAFSPDGQTLASSSWDTTVKLWEVATGKEEVTLSGHSNLVGSVSFSPDGRTLASGSADETVKLWKVSSGKEKATLSGHSGDVHSVAFSPDGRTLASASADQTVKLWTVWRGKEKSTLTGHSDDVHSVAFSPDGRTLASSSADNTVKLWEVTTGKEKVTLSMQSGDVRSVAFSPDGRTLASGSADKTFKLWEVATGKEKVAFSGHSDLVASVAFSPDGRTLASGSWDTTVKLWEVSSGKEKATLSGHSGEVSSVAFSPDGRTLASGSWDTTVKLWEVATGKEKVSLSGHSNRVESLAFSPDGKTLASGSTDNTVKLWEVVAGKEKRTFSGHLYAVSSVAFSPDGGTLASGSWDRTVKLWDVASGKEKATLSGHARELCSVAFSPDGQTLASGSRDQTVKLWDVTPLVRSNLFVYLEEGWCHFDSETEELVWNDPPQSIETPFRNVPRWSSLGVLQRTDLSSEEKDWLFYLKALEAENWAAAAIFRERLAPDQKQYPHCNVVWAIKTLLDQAKKAQEAGLPVLAEMRLTSARRFQEDLPTERKVELPQLAELPTSNAERPTSKGQTEASANPQGK